ncbi:MAG: DUF1800 domain-containing protein [Phycisphaeraceae bacterium]
MPTSSPQLDPAFAWAAYEPSAKQPWTKALAAHLFRRAGFAANTGELEQAVKQGVAATIEGLFNPAKAAEASGTKEDPAAFAQQMDTLGMTMTASGNPQGLSAYWLFRMLYTPNQLREKTTLFWHGHFATSAAKVDDARLMLQHHELLREHALGKFEPFVQAMSRDPAMLLWLDAASNRKIRPNENYARELMELFCLGVGNYTERDIKEVARAFTGWEVSRGHFRFNSFQHDESTKSFLGSTGNYNGDDAVKIVLQQPAAARFIARKLATFFVAEEPVLSDKLIEPLAKELRDNGFEIGPVVRRILSSNLFFSEQAIGRIVRSPVSLGIGLLRALEAKTNLNALAQELQQLGQAVFYPPNVKGWEGGRTWINSSTLLSRANLVRGLLHHPETKFDGGTLSALARKHGATSPQKTIDWLLELLVAVPVPGEVRQRLIKVAEQSGDANKTLADTIHAIGAMPEFQLC